MPIFLHSAAWPTAPLQGPRGCVAALELTRLALPTPSCPPRCLAAAPWAACLWDTLVRPRWQAGPLPLLLGTPAPGWGAGCHTHPVERGGSRSCARSITVAPILPAVGDRISISQPRQPSVRKLPVLGSQWK